MIMELYGIKDELNDYSYPIPFPDERQAIRYFKDQTNGGNEFITRNKEDYALIYMGQFNTVTGKIVQEEIKEVMKGKEKNE